MTEIPIYYDDTNHTPITLNKFLLAVVYTMEQIIIYLLSCIYMYTFIQCILYIKFMMVVQIADL